MAGDKGRVVVRDGDNNTIFTQSPTLAHL